MSVHNDLNHLAVIPESVLTASILIEAYENSFFPMAEDDGTLLWHSPDPRAIIPLDGVNISRSTRRLYERGNFDFTFDQSFREVITACGDRDVTWISQDIIEVYCDLHEHGNAHSVEVWRDGLLVGGLYGVARGAAFFGESMFNRMSGASKVAFVALIGHLRERGYELLDTQYINHFTEQLGATEISRDLYCQLLFSSVSKQCSFH